MNSLGPSVLGCVSIRLTFANVRCISELATMSLLVPHETGGQACISGEWDMNGSPYLAYGTERKVLCGPVWLKPLIDITEQAVQVVFAHPQLHSQTHILFVSVSHLFSSEYTDVSYYEDHVPASGDLSSRRQAWRHRAFRHQVQATQADSNKAAFPVKVCLKSNIH